MIDLDKIIESQRYKSCNCTDCKKDLMKEAIRQALELASEKAKTNYDCTVWNCQGESINKQSIMNVMDKIK